MAVDIQGFVTPEQSFGGLYQAGETLERRRLRDEQLQERKDSNLASTSRFLSNYLDNKDYLTGTVYDPEISKRLNETISMGAQLASKGATTSDIMMALSPKVNELSEYSTKARLINQQKNKAIELLRGQKGIDLNKFAQEFDNTAFFTTDPKTGQKKLKDISEIDPSTSYADQTLKDRDVFTPEGFDEFVSKSGKEKRVQDAYLYTGRGGLRRAKVETMSPTFMQPETDEKGVIKGFVPQYDIATDEDSKLVHDFKDEKGGTVNAPVRMVTDDLFNSLPDNSKAYIRQEVRKYSTQQGVPLSSQQSYNMAKVLAYDMLKQSGKNYSTINELNVEKPDRIIIDRGISSKEAKPIDLSEYPDEGDGWKNITSLMQGVKVTGLPSGKSFLAKSVLYNPNTQRVKYIEYVNKDDEKDYGGKPEEKDVSLTKFLQDIRTNNPTTDMKFIEGLRNPVGVVKTEELKPNFIYKMKNRKGEEVSLTKDDLIKAGFDTDQKIREYIDNGTIKVEKKSSKRSQ